MLYSKCGAAENAVFRESSAPTGHPAEKRKRIHYGGKHNEKKSCTFAHAGHEPRPAGRLRQQGHRRYEPQKDGESGAKQIETLKVAFVPSREPQEIITATEPLKQLLKDELAKEGYEVGEVEITVGTTYEAVGEGLDGRHHRRRPDPGRHLCSL